MVSFFIYKHHMGTLLRHGHRLDHDVRLTFFCFIGVSRNTLSSFKSQKLIKPEVYLARVS
jgi:hypothetical protein